MRNREIVKVKGWQIATAPSATGSGDWMAWAKMGPITGTNPITEPGEHVWFQFGKTREEALQKMLDELGLCG